MRIAKATRGAGIAAALLTITTLLLTGCGGVSAGLNDASTQEEAPVTATLTPEFINGLCGADPNSSNEELKAKSASKYLDDFQAAVDVVKAFPEGGAARAHQAKDVQNSWGVNPEDQASVDSTIAALKERTAVECSNALNSGATKSVGMERADGSIATADLYTGSGQTIFDQVSNPMIPALVSNDRLMESGYRGQALFTNWKEFRTVIGELPNPQWYIDGMNALKAQGRPTFTWDDTAKFAEAAEKAKLDVRVIAVYNISPEEMSDEAIRNTPEIRKMLGDAANTLHIVRYGDTWNTMKRGTADQPIMTPFLDGEKMIRVSLAPLVLDANGNVALNADGKPVIDDRDGAGVFVDCVNIHWIEKYISKWECTGSSCAPPPEKVCPYNPALPVDSPNCVPPVTPPPSDAKNNAYTPDNNGWTPRGLDNGLTDGGESRRQINSGDTRGNGGEHQVGGNTNSGDNTGSTGNDVAVGGATPGGDSPKGTVQDPDLVKDDGGGTQGATCVPNQFVTC